MSISIDNWRHELLAGGRRQFESGETLRRKRVADALATATLQELKDAWDRLPIRPDIIPVRGPEAGLVMVRGRTGGAGQPFNLGEVVVSRATVRLENGVIGHGHVLGNARERARLAAVFDALAQCEEHEAAVAALLDAVRTRAASEETRRAEEVAATRVDFFTMVRGDD
jgi:alpha-D-ribose 1-methylphosphonate 5-triphosphate synthase subunit PhnG